MSNDRHDDPDHTPSWESVNRLAVHLFGPCTLSWQTDFQQHTDGSHRRTGGAWFVHAKHPYPIEIGKTLEDAEWELLRLKALRRRRST